MSAIDRALTIVDQLDPEEKWYKDLTAEVLRESYASIPHPKSWWFLIYKIRFVWQLNRALSSLHHSNQFLNNMILQMPGVSILATYLRDKHHLNGLYVCSSFEAFQKKLEEMSQMPGDSRCAWIIDATLDTESSHKITVCFEKKGDSFKIAILDALGNSPEDFSPTIATASAEWIKKHVAEFHRLPYGLYVLWYIYHSIIDLKQAQIYFSSVERQHSTFGCDTFSLRDAKTYLKSPDFFDTIQVEDCIVSHKGQELELSEIKVLPPLFMKGAQSLRLLDESLKTSLADHISEGVNHYTTQRTIKYYLIVLEALRLLTAEKIRSLMSKTLITAQRPPVSRDQFPLTLNDIR